MIQCKCGSYAINDDPKKEVCDKCLLKARIAELKAELAEYKENTKVCEWSFENGSFGGWKSSCGMMGRTESPSAGEFQFCPYCGLRVKEIKGE